MVRDLINAPEFRDGSRWIRFDAHDLRRYLRRAEVPRHRGDVGTRYHIESRTDRGTVSGQWRWWMPDFDSLDAIGVLVEPDGAA